MFYPSSPPLPRPPVLRVLCDLTGHSLAWPLLPVWMWGFWLPWKHRRTAIALGMHAVKVCLNPERFRGKQLEDGQKGTVQGNLD